MNLIPQPHTKITYDTSKHTSETLLSLYRSLLMPRLIEEKMLTLLRQGKISKWFSGIGQEAIAVGVTAVLQSQEYILPMHRNLGVFTTRNVPLHRLFSQWQGKANGFTKGRDRSFHFGSQEYKIVGMISHLGPQLGVACGIALGNKLRDKKEVVVVFTGEGGTSEGDFHEALNLASVWKLPVLFCIENNGYGLSTPVDEQYACEHLADRAAGYGMKSQIVDGNNILEVHDIIEELCAEVREHSTPVLVEFKTFRMRGHEEASGTKYVSDALMKQWAEKDPIENFKAFLNQEGVLSEEEDKKIHETLKSIIDEQWQQANEAPTITPDLETELEDVYHKHLYSKIYPSSATSEKRLIDAISDGLKQSMQRHENLVIMGQDIAEYGGVFKITEGFVDEFGKERVRNTPICESAVIAAAYGLSVNNFKAVMEMQFADFVSSGFNPIVNLLAKSNYRWGQKADVVIRMPCGAGVGAGPFHSQTNEAWFTKTPGLKVVYPAFPADAKGLLAAAIDDPNPVLFFEHKALYRSIREEVPDDIYTIPLGEAKVLRSGTDITILTYGAAVHWALEELDQQPDIAADLVDLRCLKPLDLDTIITSVKKTGKVIILQEDTLFNSMASELSAILHENCFEFLDAAIVRVGSIETPIPFNSELERQYLAKSQFKEALLNLHSY
ncbi:alpha-ketoacid dehydrogenase subunit alpha/beta [Aquimarina brevivitae]|uniref:2-oxoisovalerate dehydrogenase E1 component n=1 Tax=Aquimarina brevivitae TaxID=323412 RepID=A0A4Q7NUC2_9FLAO|nr:dehydrogenase E1 component subunit alpha/beta [Aquimarina brevivitae]RZS90654.1 2-oxoisovalerate dehydrogenase E1 component [Aquimarina brevivitae]